MQKIVESEVELLIMVAFNIQREGILSSKKI